MNKVTQKLLLVSFVLMFVMGSALVGCARVETVTKTVTTTEAAVTITETVTAPPVTVTATPPAVTVTKTTTVTKEVPVTATPVAIKWRMQSCDPVGSFDYTANLVQFCDLVSEYTNGQIEITPYPAPALMKATEMLDAVTKGALDGLAAWMVYFMGKDKGMEFWCEWPYGVNMSYADMLVFYYELGGKELYNEFLAQFDAIEIACPPHPGEPIHSTVPIPRLADMRGLKMRTYSIAALVYTRAGIHVTPITPAELYTSLERGIIDIMEYTSLATNIGMKLHEPAPYMIKPAHSTAVLGHSIVLKKSQFEALPEDLQRAIMAAAKEMTLRVIHQNKMLELDLMQRLPELGIEWHMWPQEDYDEMAGYSMEIWEGYLKGLHGIEQTTEFGQKMIDIKLRYTELIREYGDAVCR
ncbi:MAG TPA: hypothetical protein G4O03_07270 [Dehalococcoidia bacterium]|nr:hypothetical protein [Dehalococcoidia bacterium]